MGIGIKGQNSLWPLEDSLEELAQLARAGGAQVVGELTQRIDRPTQVYLGKGKLEDLKALKTTSQYDTVIFDDELSPVQQRNLEQFLDSKVIDRTALILDVFSQSAQTREGQLQVELAQHRYLLPRLRGQWSHLERLGGGIGTRGPGESQLETDRRLIRKRIQKLERDLQEVRQHRGLYRKRRKEQGVPVVALVGYTNSGKSTLFNSLGRASVITKDKLFSTLDPVTRRIFLEGNLPLLLTDTVGFIQKLPPSLIAAFRATLEELNEADVILHVVDISHRNAPEQVQVVQHIIADLGLTHKPCVMALNKIDLLFDESHRLEDTIGTTFPGPMAMISALKKRGLEDLLLKIQQAIKILPFTPHIGITPTVINPR